MISAETATRSKGYEIGLQFAAHGVRPPRDVHPDVRAGYASGFEQLKGFSLYDRDPAIAKWLGIKASAWARNRVIDPAITPDYLRRTLFTSYCPITREPFTTRPGSLNNWSIDRVVNSAGYCPGNLAAVSVKVNQAKDRYSYSELKAIAANPEAHPELKPIEWVRLANLVGMVEEKDELLPFLVFPPPTLLVGNPATCIALPLVVSMLQSLNTHACRNHSQEYLLLRTAMRRTSLPAMRAFDSFVWLYGRIYRALPKYPGVSSTTSMMWRLNDAWLHPALVTAFQTLVKCAPFFRSPEFQTWANDTDYEKVRANWHEETLGYVPGTRNHAKTHQACAAQAAR